MTYEELKQLTAGKQLPLMGESADGEAVIVSEGSCDGNHYYQVETYQSNGWIRVNGYYEDGETDETFKR